ncbi:ATP/GTP-binding protein [Streptomyces canus]|uniref:GTP-binding protein n=1 Tax=Streptomyces canus TaxID=58343 RepID=UPI00340966F4
MLKIMVAGGFGVGKTTFIGAISDIEPLVTEEVLTESSAGFDNLAGLTDKVTTTVAFDFGSLIVDSGDGLLELLLFGTPGQARFADYWHDLSRGAVGVVILADTRRLDISFPALTFSEQAGLPHIIAVNEWDGSYRYPMHDVRQALRLHPSIPMVTCDARERSSVRDSLLCLVKHALTFTPPATSRLDAR